MQRLLLELLPCLVVGLVLGRTYPRLSARLAGPLIRWGVPISLVGLLLRSGMRSDLAVTALIALLGPSLGLLLIATVPWLAERLDSGPLRLGALVGNTAYWGVPVALALLPTVAVAHAITYDIVATLFTWNVGPLLMERRFAGLGPLVRRLLQNPASQGLAVALLLQQTPWSAPLGQWLWWPARLVLWLALTMVGMRLGMMLRLPLTLAWPRQGLLAAVSAKLVLAPALMLLLSTLVRLPETARTAVVLQAAAPSALAVLLLAEARGEDAQPAANLVLASTALALVTVPLWWTLCGFLGS